MKITEQRLRQLIRGLLVEGTVADEEIKKAVPLDELKTVAAILKAKNYKKDIKVKRELYKLANKHIKNIKNLDSALEGKKNVRGKSKEIAALIYWGNKWSRRAEKIQANIIKKIRETYKVTASTASKSTKSTKATTASKATKATPTKLTDLATLVVTDTLQDQLSKYNTLDDVAVGFKEINESIRAQWNSEDAAGTQTFIQTNIKSLVAREEVFSKAILDFFGNTLETIAFPDSDNAYRGTILSGSEVEKIKKLDSANGQSIGNMLDAYYDDNREYGEDCWQRLVKFIATYLTPKAREYIYSNLFLNVLIGGSKYNNVRNDDEEESGAGSSAGGEDGGGESEGGGEDGGSGGEGAEELPTLTTDSIEGQLTHYTRIDDVLDGFDAINDQIKQQWNPKADNSLLDAIENNIDMLVEREEKFTKAILVFLGEALGEVTFPNGDNVYKGKICAWDISEDILSSVKPASIYPTIGAVIDSYSAEDAKENWSRLIHFLETYIIPELDNTFYLNLFVNKLLGTSKYHK